MKTPTLRGLRLGLALWLGCGIVASLAADSPPAGPFPYSVPFDLGKGQFAPGDNISIQTVRGTAATFQTNETYSVEGTYTLSSREEADLALFVTTRQDIRTKTDPRQIVRIKKGTGFFRLVQTLSVEGYPHVSFYPLPSGSSFGGIYFGQGDWLWTENGPGPTGASRSAKAGGEAAASQIVLTGANRTLLEYLGNPVEAPAGLEPAYTPAGLRQAVQSAATNAGISLRAIAIDESEFPFFIGVVGAEGDFPKLKAQLLKLEPYEYYGDVGSPKCTIFTIIPARIWPAEARQRIYHRATLRMQIFYDQVSSRP